MLKIILKKGGYMQFKRKCYEMHMPKIVFAKK